MFLDLFLFGKIAAASKKFRLCCLANALRNWDMFPPFQRPACVQDVSDQKLSPFPGFATDACTNPGAPVWFSRGGDVLLGSSNRKVTLPTRMNPVL